MNHDEIWHNPFDISNLYIPTYNIPYIPDIPYLYNYLTYQNIKFEISHGTISNKKETRSCSLGSPRRTPSPLRTCAGKYYSRPDGGLETLMEGLFLG